MATSSLRFRRKPPSPEMAKPDGNSVKDATLVQSCGKLSGQISKDLNGNQESYSNLSFTEGKLVIDLANNPDSAKKRKFNEIEPVSTNVFRNNCPVDLEPTSKRKYSSNQDDGLDLSLSLPGSNKKNESFKQGDTSSLPQQEPNRDLTLGSKLDVRSELIVMSCLHCLMHVMVCDDNPKCPLCRKGEWLLDIYR